VTVKRLVLVRHAKAESAERDVARPLAGDGRRDARAVGEWLAQYAVPDLALVSPALRARETWDCAADALASPVAVTVDDRIYANTVTDLVATVQQCAEVVTTLALVGHNPSVQALAASARRESDVAMAALVSFPTATVVVLAVDGSWSEFDPARARVLDMRTCRASQS